MVAAAARWWDFKYRVHRLATVATSLPVHRLVTVATSYGVIVYERPWLRAP